MVSEKDYEIALLGVPWDWNITGRPGSRFSPATIRKYLYSSTTLHPELGEPACSLRDYGDVRVAPGDWVETRSRIKLAIQKVYREEGNFIVIGGDHSITGPIIEALLEKGSIGLLFLDSHYDMRSLSEGHSSGTWLRELYEKHGSNKIKTLLIGVGDYTNPPYLKKTASQYGVRVVSMWEIIKNGISTALEAIDEFSDIGVDQYYISVDMDHLDQSYAPGVNAPNPLGMSPRETLLLLEHAVRKLNPVGIDFTEVSPLVDVADSTSRLAASLIAHSIHFICTGVTRQ
ncbi:MAG: agmatinase family protein [Desulfurococcales archaeon]|nr:agmatinase family protein [Desulfurococcales archaeon]